MPVDTSQLEALARDQAGAPNTVSGNRYDTIWTNTDYAAWPQQGSV